MHAGDLHAGGLEAMQPARRGLPVHAAAAPVQQDRPGDAVADGAVDRACYGGWHGHKQDLVALADDPQHPMPVLFAEVGDVQAGRFGDP